MLGRFAYTIPDQSADEEKYVWGAGVGMDVNQHLRLAVYFDQYTEDSSNASRAYLKSEITF